MGDGSPGKFVVSRLGEAYDAGNGDPNRDFRQMIFLARNKSLVVGTFLRVFDGCGLYRVLDSAGRSKFPILEAPGEN